MNHNERNLYEIERAIYGLRRLRERFLKTGAEEIPYCTGVALEVLEEAKKKATPDPDEAFPTTPEAVADFVDDDIREGRPENTRDGFLEINDDLDKAKQLVHMISKTLLEHQLPGIVCKSTISDLILLCDIAEKTIDNVTNELEDL